MRAGADEQSSLNMELDTSFLQGAGDATADNSTAQTSAPESTQTESAPATQEVATEQAVSAPPAAEGGQAAAPAVETQPAAEAQAEEEAYNEEELLKLADDPKTPAWFRSQLKKANGYSNKLKTDYQTLQTEFENLKTQYSPFEGKEALAQTDIERLRAAEEAQYKLSSYTATPDEILGSLNEIVAPQKLSEIKNKLAWEFLEMPDGTPDLENLQVIIDRFAGHKDGEDRVAAKDVLNAIQALKRGVVKPHELHEFTSDAEYDAYQKAREMELQIDQQRQIAKANADFQERAARGTVINSVVAGVQGQFQPQVEALLNKFQLNHVENEPKVAAEYKAAVRERIAQEVQKVSGANKSLSDVFNTLKLLSEPNGKQADAIQHEINAYVSSFPYQTALSRGLSELMSAVEKVVTKEAYQYKLLMAGYQQEVGKGQNAREVIGQPKQTEILAAYTPEQLAQMGAAERRHAELMNISNQLREMGKVPRLGN